MSEHQLEEDLKEFEETKARYIARFRYSKESYPEKSQVDS